MANVTRSGRKLKDTNSTPNSDTAAVLRRSSRESPSNKPIIASPPSIRKSQRIEKRTPPPTPVSNNKSTSLASSRKPIPVIMGKKRLDARTYRESLLKSQANKTNKLDLAEKLKKQEDISPGQSEHKECSERAPDGSSTTLEKLEEQIGETESSHPCRKRKINSISKCSYNSHQPSRQVSVKDAVVDADSTQADCSDRQNSPKVPMESTSEERSISKDHPCSGKVHTIEISKRMRTSEELDSDVSTKEPIYPAADPVTSPSSKSKQTTLFEHCDACSNRQRLEVVPEKCIMCSCNNGKDHVQHNISSLEDGGEFTTKACGGSNEECYDDMQTDYDNNACAICRLEGKLLRCGGKGCKRNYHCYCLDPPLKAAPLGVWHCFQCIKKKIQFGVYSVSEGIESICDVREEGVPDCEEIQKQYLVKYEGLAHAHNRWIPEDQLFHEVPSLVAKFKKNQALKWKPEWMRPQRLVQKRSLMTPNQGSGSFGDCQYEWYVKWSGLGYEHATWELENAPFLKSPEAIPLIKDYETRLENALRASDPSTKKSLEERKLSSCKVSKLPSKNMAGVDNDHLNFVNKLREYWHKNQNVIVEDQERILKVVLFILSLQSDVCRPFLIISTSSGISAWEAELMHVAPSVNVVVYNGNKEVRESIRSLEFYADGDCVTVQVLLSTIDAVIEDLEALELIQWEALIVDDCQQPRVSRHFEEVKRLPCGFRILLLNGSVKESIAEYLNILSFVDSKDDGHADVGMEVDSGNSNTITKLKENLAHFVVCERKVDSSKFVEYWVPVQLSNVQLEQYCATLLSSSDSLRSCSKNDPVGALRDILISVRKCCDHPYLVDQSLQTLLTKDVPEVEYLDVGVNASGKLKFLDRILSEIKRRGLRVLILFQSIGGSARNNIGDILDDFLRQRFGPDSYERVDSGLVNSKKQAALNMFNNKERGRFVFLIENRACLPSIKLSSVDMVILFDSDWNPLNDLRALQKITIDSQFEQLKVFRLYSTCTVEEKVLALAKQDMILDSNIQNISRSTSHTLLLWGAHFLFHRLDEFHSGCTPCTGSNLEQTFLNGVVQDFLNQLPTASELEVTKICKIILKAQQIGASYSKDIILVGEKEMQLIDEELPHVSWTNLLDGRSPRWRCTSGPSQRVRRKVQYYDNLPKKTPDSDEASKKRKKSYNDTNGSNTLKNCSDNKKQSVSTNKEEASCTPTFDGSQNFLASTVNADSANHPVPDNLNDSQKNLRLSLKPVIINLCEILQLPDDVKSMAAKFLEYIINNFKVTREPVTIFQAFQISLCWSAASLLNYKVSHKNSLSLAKKHLDFQCKEEETQLIYSVMRPQRQNFFNQLKCSESISAETSSPRDKHSQHVRASEPTLDAQQQIAEGEIRESPKSHQCSMQSGQSKLKQTDDSENTSGLSKNDSSQSVEHVKIVHSRRMKKIYQKQMEEFQKFNEYREKENADLEMKHQLETVIIGKIHSQSSVRFEKQKKIDQEFEKKKEQLNIQMEAKQKKLQSIQRQARDKEKQMNAHWLEEAQSGRTVATYATLPLCSSGFRVENVEELGEDVISDENKDAAEQVGDCEQGGGELENLLMSSTAYLEKQDRDDTVSVLPAEAVSLDICAFAPDKLDGTVSTVPQSLGEMSTVLKTSVSLSAAADMGSMQQTTPFNSNSGSPSLEPALLGHPLNQDGTVSTVPQSLGETSTVLKTSVSLSAAADMGSMQQTTPFDSNSGSPSLEPALLGHPLNQDQAISPRYSQAPCVDQCADPSVEVAGLLDVEVSGCEVQSLSHVESQMQQSPSIQLDPSALDDPQSTEQSQSCMPTCTLVGQEQATGPLQQLVEGPVQDPPLEHQNSIPHQSQVPATDDVSSQQTPVSAPLTAPPTISASVVLDDSQPHLGACQPAQVLVPSIDSLLLSTEQSQSANTRVNQEQVAHFEAQIQLPLEDPLLDYQMRHTLSQVARQPPATEQIVGWNSSSVSRTQSLLQLPSRENGPPRLPIGVSPARPPQINPRQFSDPLQNELIRIKREEEQVMKMHEEEKVKLNNECEKQIEEIRKKYNNMLEEAELDLGQKKKALETNYNIVYMNKILADAFRMKCDARNSSGLQPQQQGPAWSSSPPIGTQRPVAPAVQTVVHQAVAPAVQTVVHQASALFSSNPRSQFHHPPKAVSEMRSPAPHLQPFRPVGALSPSTHLHPLMRGPNPPQSVESHPQALLERMTAAAANTQVRRGSSSSTIVCLSDDD